MGVKCFAGLLASLVIGIASEWEETGPLEKAIPVFMLSYDNMGNIYAATEIWGDIGVVFKTTDKGATWERTAPLPGITSTHSVLCARDGTVYSGCKGRKAKVFKSTDGGETWIETGDLEGAKPSVYCLLETEDGTIYAGTNQGVYKSTDRGETWKITAPIPGGGIRSLLEIPNYAIYAGGFVGGETTAYVYKSTNGGDSWERTGKFPALKVGCIMSLYYANDVLYAGTGCITGEQLVPRVFKSTDKGEHWTKAGELPADAGESVWGLIKTKKGVLYAGTAWGFFGRKGIGKIFKSSNDLSWTLSASFPASPGSNGVTSFIQTPDGTIYAAVIAGLVGKVYKNLSETGTTGIEEKITSSFAFQKYPSPFSKSITIRFQLPVKTSISLRVYDITGKVVRVLKKTQSLEPGTYTLKWDGRGDKGEVPAGVYFIELKTPEGRAIEKVVKD